MTLQTAMVSIQDIKKDNPRLCLSALRFTGSCYKCEKFEQYSKMSDKTSICDSRIISEQGQQFIKNKEKVKQLQEQIKVVEQEIKELQEV